MPVLPRSQIDALGQRFRAASEKRPQREQQHLIQRGRRFSWCPHFRVVGGIDPRRCVVPIGHERLERVSFPPERNDLVVVRALERFEPLKDVGGLAERQTEIGPLERDVAKAHERTSGRLLRSQPLGVHLNPGQRHAALHSPLHVDERELHIHG